MIVTKPTQKTVRELHKFIKNSFSQHSNDNIYMYRDVREKHARRAFKSVRISTVNAWKHVIEDLEEAGIKGFELYSTRDPFAACLQVGIVRKEGL